MLALATLVIVFVAGAQAHMCMLSPAQRGDMANINTPAAGDCYLTTSPCGGRAAGPASVYLRAGMTYTIVIQKNASHRLANHPGDFTVRMLQGEDDKQGVTLAQFADTDAGALTLYPVTVTIPSNARGVYVIQADYRTNNHNAPAHFYQCADVEVV